MPCMAVTQFELGHRMQPGRIHDVKVAQESRRGRDLGARLHDHEARQKEMRIIISYDPILHSITTLALQLTSSAFFSIYKSCTYRVANLRT
jgi:hypothetical protein